MVAPVRIGGVAGIAAEAGARAGFIREKKARDAPGYFLRDLREIHERAGAGGELDLQFVAPEMVVALERLDEQVVHRQPNGAAPVRVAAKHAGLRLTGLVADAVVVAVERERVGRVAIDARE